MLLALDDQCTICVNSGQVGPSQRQVHQCTSRESCKFLTRVRNGWLCQESGRFYDDPDLVDTRFEPGQDHRYDKMRQLESEGITGNYSDWSIADKNLLRVHRQVMADEEDRGETKGDMREIVMMQNRSVDLALWKLRTCLHQQAMQTVERMVCTDVSREIIEDVAKASVHYYLELRHFNAANLFPEKFTRSYLLSYHTFTFVYMCVSPDKEARYGLPHWPNFTADDVWSDRVLGSQGPSGNMRGFQTRNITTYRHHLSRGLISIRSCITHYVPFGTTPSRLGRECLRWAWEFGVVLQSKRK